MENSEDQQLLSLRKQIRKEELMADGQAGLDALDTIYNYLHEHTDHRPEIGIICGSGLSGLSKCLENQHVIPYEDIPGFPKATVPGHSGELVFGELCGGKVVCMRGRFHTYEGHPIQTTTLPVRVMALLGVKTLIVTNAAGGLNTKFNVGDLMVIGDHCNFPGLAGKHPLVGPNDERFGDRFTPLSDCYNIRLQNTAWRVAQRMGLCEKFHRNGVYCFVSGPTYETPIEAKLLRLLGGDSVGMSTVPEVVVAAHCGMKVLGISLITNKVILPGDKGSAANHEEVLEAVKASQNDIQNFVKNVILEIHSMGNSLHTEPDHEHDHHPKYPAIRPSNDRSWNVTISITPEAVGVALLASVATFVLLRR